MIPRFGGDSRGPPDDGGRDADGGLGLGPAWPGASGVKSAGGAAPQIALRRRAEPNCPSVISPSGRAGSQRNARVKLSRHTFWGGGCARAFRRGRAGRVERSEWR